jgi:hypothetical protein
MKGLFKCHNHLIICLPTALLKLSTLHCSINYIFSDTVKGIKAPADVCYLAYNRTCQEKYNLTLPVLLSPRHAFITLVSIFMGFYFSILIIKMGAKLSTLSLHQRYHLIILSSP